MTDKTLKIILGIIAVNLTIQTVKDVGLFPTAYAQNGIQKVQICNDIGNWCATVFPDISASGEELPSRRLWVGP
ncbi:MAG TPA: hypothetical protein EYQ33_06220 [Gammaproteobacteria bacterium]|jgi:hypothetical protein|nr:hypothetical protein [Gammaproteobacteria bacterium]